MGDRRFWEGRYVALALVLLAALPLIGPDIPPLADLPGHMGRYRVQLDLDASAPLRRFYEFRWALIANLGVDLLVEPLAPLLGLEGAVKLIVATIPPLAAAGFLWTAREAHGRIGPAALWAPPLAYGFPFQYGFVNFSLSAALAFVALGLWLRLGARGRWRLRAALFAPIAVLLWVAHVYGWALFALLAAATELFRQRARGGGWARTVARTFIQGLVLAPPLLLMLAWRSDADGASADWFNWPRKGDWIAMALRDRWQAFDIAAIAMLGAVIAVALGLQVRRLWRRPPGRGAFDPGLGLAAAMLAVAFVLAPGTVFGSAYADMRLVPYAFAVALIAIRPDAWGAFGRAVAVGGLLFTAARTAGTAASFALHDRAWRAELAALDRLPPGARLLSFTTKDCPAGWGTPRFDHLPSLALARRGAFANDQWDMPGAQLLSVRYPAAGGFARDPSQFVTANDCMSGFRTIDAALAGFPRAGFDHLWLIDPPAHDPRLVATFRPLWRRGNSVLYRIAR